MFSSLNITDAQGVPQLSVKGPFNLTGFHLGMWSSRKHRALSTLVLDDKLVVFVDRTVRLAPSQSGGPSSESLKHSQFADVREKMLNIINHLPKPATSPFRVPNERSAQQGSVLAYEIEWKKVVGFDFRNELCHDGRLALEVKHLQRVQFPCIRSAYRYLLPTRSTSSNTNRVARPVQI
eukprot:6692372-Pyramimonas_sp.AAC.1